jgi:S-DNA-T family DNA segregation ATPase FtsK/SpoIIIE
MSDHLSRDKIKREIIGVSVLLVGVFLLISFISYHPNDRAFYFVYNTEKVNNWGGIIGATMARALFQLIGLGSYLLPLIIFLFAYRFFTPSDVFPDYFRLISSIVMILSLIGLFDLTLGGVKIKGDAIAAGGILGNFLTRKLMVYLNPIGTYCFYLSFLLLSFFGLTHLSPVRLASSLRRLFVNITKSNISLYRTLQGRLKKEKIEIVEKGRVAPIEEIREAVRVEEESPVIFEQEKEIQDDVQEKPQPDEKKVKAVKEIKEVKEYKLPPLSFLDLPDQKLGKMDKEALLNQSKTLEKKLKDFGVEGKVVGINPGPVITRFEFEPAAGIKINKVVGLADDLALALRAMSVRIVAPIPGKGAIGIEVPNAVRETVYFKEIVSQDAFLKSTSKLTLALGKDLSGEPVITTLGSMPHLLIAGATGAGKSVLINTMICSILYKATPAEVKMLMIDPKRLELSLYEGIPHLLYPVVTDPKKAALALRWAVEEMERRYSKLAEKGVRDIDRYNQKIGEEQKNGSRIPTVDEMMEYEEEEPGGGHEILPYIVIVIDELADLMMVSFREVEGSLTRLAQMARAAGIHLIVATQRPSVDVLTGTIKVNFPTRISFQVSSKIDSRTILDTIGAERLLGKGDMLFLPPGTSRLVRIHSAYVSESEIVRIVEFLKEQSTPSYDESILTVAESDTLTPEDEDFDEKYAEAVALVTETRQASISMIQRRLRVGYNRAARMIERMEEEGIVSQTDGIKPREVLVRKF